MREVLKILTIYQISSADFGVACSWYGFQFLKFKCSLSHLLGRKKIAFMLLLTPLHKAAHFSFEWCVQIIFNFVVLFNLISIHLFMYLPKFDVLDLNHIYLLGFLLLM